MTEPRVVYVGVRHFSSSRNRVVLKCLTCPHQPLVTDTDLHEKNYHPLTAHDPALVEKAARAVCRDDHPDRGDHSCCWLSMEEATAVLDAVADDLREQGAVDALRDDEALVEKVFDALDAAHDATRHIHAAECCFPPNGATSAVLDAVSDDLREQGRAEVRAVRDREFGNLRWMDGHQQGLTDGRAEVRAAVEAVLNECDLGSEPYWIDFQRIRAALDRIEGDTA